MLTGVHEHVHAGVRRGELVAVERTRENRCRHCRLQFVAVDAVTHDDELHRAAGGQPGEPLDVFFGREPAHEPDDGLAVR